MRAGPFTLFIALVCLLACGARKGWEEEDLLLGRSPRVATFARAAERVTDGVAAVEGDAFKTQLTSVIEPGGGIEWDLGERRRLSHAAMIADYDDYYAVLTSDDGRMWSQVWEAAPVAGGGQRLRAASALVAEGRFVRLEPRGGDGTYSVSELVLAFQPKAAFPPPLMQERGKRQPDARKRPSRIAIGAALSLAFASFFPLLFSARGAASQGTPSNVSLSRRRTIAIAGAAAALVLLTAASYSAEYRFRLVDDAYISLQYAKNWASGLGLVFNPGERVEGFTNFLWIAAITPLWWIAGEPEGFTKLVLALTMILAATGVALVACVARTLFLSRLLPVALAVLLVAFDDSYVAYAAFGLEKHLLVVGMLAGLWLASTRPIAWEIWLGVSFALVAMTRPDGLLWAGTYFVAQLSRFVREDPNAERLRPGSLVRVAAALALTFGVYFACRYAYYGDPLPNTFYLKVGATFGGVRRGLAYVGDFVAQRYGVPVFALGAVIAIRSLWVRWVLCHVVLHAAYIVYVGGDFYPGHRFLIVLVPSLALLVAAVFQGVAERAGSRVPGAVLFAAATTLCVLARIGTLRRGPYTQEIQHWANTVDQNVRSMQWLRGVARPGSSMVVGDIGATGLFANIRVLDVFGVVDPEVARQSVAGFGSGKAGHEKIAPTAALLAKKPTYIKWGYIDAKAVPRDEYYLFNAFPPSLRIDGLWVRDDLAGGALVEAAGWAMDRDALTRWTRSGSAFSDVPSARPRRGQPPIVGQRGAFVNSFTKAEGNAATGRLLSPEFPLVGERLRLLVGGGRDPVRLRVSLLVAGRAVFSETGSNAPTLGRREWDVRDRSGQTAQIEIVDDATWGHLLVDEIEQWSCPCPSSATL